MKYGCIGERLGHSFSKEIHGYISDYDYVIREVAKDELDSFMLKKDFTAINVTIPYKEAVIPYLSYVDDSASLIGSVNTIVNKDGELYGYNTDFYGMTMLARSMGVSFEGRKVLILGTGGTSKTAFAVAKAHGAREIIKASRTLKDNAILYTDVYKNHTDAEIIINTTPVGMYPNIFDSPIDISEFKNIYAVIDAIYNPERTPLILKAQEMGIKAMGGLYMLVAQAVKASEYFLDTKYPDAILNDVFSKILAEKKNIVLIGMPACGKSTVGKILADRLSKIFVDTDEEIVKSEGEDIHTIFEKHGEHAFRDMESEAIRLVSAGNNAIISTGGGAILREGNINALRENGRIYFIDRPLNELIPTADRPTASTKEAIKKRYNERYGLYTKYADKIIDASCSAEETAKKIINDFNSSIKNQPDITL